ncbi:unnamed protein product [Protopolystoma xenopodis]|uniref:Uncharacterized protein n=1 Tax=Protopolystoma xenopodis TaxID=117903 RepID=A0A3S5AAZ0_9PLAT|nr:unnamed protein product [Protopolystoma xenopodis]
MPVSELPHSANLVCLIGSANSSSVTGTNNYLSTPGSSANNISSAFTGHIHSSPRSNTSSELAITSSGLPQSCLAISPSGGNLRFWPRFMLRPTAFIDVNLSEPVAGLYGDEAKQLEPGPLTVVT